MPYVTSIVVAAGSGSRMGTQTKKQYLTLNNKPLLIYTLEVMEKQDKIKETVLVVPSNDIDFCKDLIKEYSIQKVINIAAGGDTRGASVFNGLQAVPKDSEFVVVHDGARPFLSQQVLIEALKTGIREGAAIVAVPVKDTIKQARPDGVVQCTLDRSSLWSVQTPQVFSKDLLVQCYEKAYKEDFQGTDDASLIEAFGHPVKIVKGDYRNIKITTKEDIGYAEYLLGQGGID